MSHTKNQNWGGGEKLKERSNKLEFKTWKAQLENDFHLHGRVGALIAGDLAIELKHSKLMAREALADWKAAETAQEKVTVLRKLKGAARIAERDSNKAKSELRKETDIMKALIKRSLDHSCLPFCMTSDGKEFKEGPAMLANIVNKFEGTSRVDKLAAVTRVRNLAQGPKESITSYFQRVKEARAAVEALKLTAKNIVELQAIHGIKPEFTAVVRMLNIQSSGKIEMEALETALLLTEANNLTGIQRGSAYFSDAGFNPRQARQSDTCYLWQKEGTCRFGARCKFKHEGGKGEQKKKGNPKQNNQAKEIADLKKKLKQVETEAASYKDQVQLNMARIQLGEDSESENGEAEVTEIDPNFKFDANFRTFYSSAAEAEAPLADDTGNPFTISVLSETGENTKDKKSFTADKAVEENTPGGYLSYRLWSRNETGGGGPAVRQAPPARKVRSEVAQAAAFVSSLKKNYSYPVCKIIRLMCAWLILFGWGIMTSLCRRARRGPNNNKSKKGSKLFTRGANYTSADTARKRNHSWQLEKGRGMVLKMFTASQA